MQVYGAPVALRLHCVFIKNVLVVALCHFHLGQYQHQ
jgi:hypothetical protein